MQTPGTFRYDRAWAFTWGKSEPERYFVIRRPAGTPTKEYGWKNIRVWWTLFGWLWYSDRRKAMACALRMGRKDPKHEYGIYWWKQVKTLQRYYVTRGGRKKGEAGA